MHRALRAMTAALAAGLRRTARLLALATGRRIAITAGVGQHVSARTYDSDQHHRGECPERYSFHCLLPLCVECRSSSDVIIASRNAYGKADSISWAAAAVAQKAHDALA
jgi:hypothetical protein